MINEDKPTTVLINDIKIEQRETWDTDLNTWDNELRTWDETGIVIDNLNKITSSITNEDKP